MDAEPRLGLLSRDDVQKEEMRCMVASLSVGARLLRPWSQLVNYDRRTVFWPGMEASARTQRMLGWGAPPVSSVPRYWSLVTLFQNDSVDQEAVVPTESVGYLVD